MKKQTLPYPPGFVEPTTGRVAVLVREYAASDLNGDAPAYWYSAQSEEWGLDPWRLVEGVHPHVHGGSFDVCFASGGTRTVGPLMTFFVRGGGGGGARSFARRVADGALRNAGGRGSARPRRPQAPSRAVFG
uniref:KleF n=1 Tax=Comamonas testosteroni CNB-1 TaxID=543891 RepID=A7K7G7_COMTE|nr:KleF [Comamonas testosteroni CNB-1]